MLCITKLAHTPWTDAHSVINSDKEINMVSNCSDKYEEYPVKTNWRVIILRSAVTDENARKCAFARFFIKCLLWHETYAKWIWDDLEQFQNLRAHWRADIRACARFFKLILIGRILTLIMINMNEERLSVMKICSWVDFHKMAPRWRHGDLESLKSHAVLISIISTSFMIIALFILEISCEQIRGRIIIEKSWRNQKVIRRLRYVSPNNAFHISSINKLFWILIMKVLPIIKKRLCLWIRWWRY